MTLYPSSSEDEASRATLFASTEARKAIRERPLASRMTRNVPRDVDRTCPSTAAAGIRSDFAAGLARRPRRSRPRSPVVRAPSTPDRRRTRPAPLPYPPVRSHLAAFRQSCMPQRATGLNAGLVMIVATARWRGRDLAACAPRSQDGCMPGPALRTVPAGTGSGTRPLRLPLLKTGTFQALQSGLPR